MDFVLITGGISCWIYKGIITLGLLIEYVLNLRQRFCFDNWRNQWNRTLRTFLMQWIDLLRFENLITLNNINL